MANAVRHAELVHIIVHVIACTAHPINVKGVINKQKHVMLNYAPTLTTGLRGLRVVYHA